MNVDRFVAWGFIVFGVIDCLASHYWTGALQILLGSQMLQLDDAKAALRRRR